MEDRRLVAYLDEFGHVGPFIEDGHSKFGQHPIFGYAGFILPASNARAIGAEFKRVKTSLFKTEIDKSSAPAQWERKGSEYFTSGSIQARPEQIRAFKGLMHDALRETINRICTHADAANEDVLILMDSFTDKTRQELAAKMCAHIYSRRRTEMKRIIEAPLHIESKLNSGIQMADWVCALIGRAAHFQLIQDSQFGWAAEHFRSQVRGMFTHESKLHLLYGSKIHHSDLFKNASVRFPQPQPGTLGARVPDLQMVYDAALRARSEQRSR